MILDIAAAMGDPESVRPYLIALAESAYASDPVAMSQWVYTMASRGK